MDKLDDDNLENASFSGDGGRGTPSSTKKTNNNESGQKRKMTNKEKFEFADLEKSIEVLGQRTKELEGQLAVAQAANKK